MHQAELEEWKKYRAIDTTFTLVDKLRNAVPKNVKWIDKNVHKVIRNILELKDKEMQVCSLDNVTCHFNRLAIRHWNKEETDLAR